MCCMDSMRSACKQNEGRNLIELLKQTTRFKLRKIIEQVDEARTMPMMVAQEASIIDIIEVPFLLPKPCGAVLVFEAVLAGAPREACVQNGTCKGAHDALTEGGLEDSKSLPVLKFPYESARFGEARTLRNSEEAWGETEVPLGGGGGHLWL